MNISFTGHRDFDLERHGESLRGVIMSHLDIEDRAVIFLSGMAVGFDLAAAECVLALRDEGLNVRLHCVLPYSEQSLFFDKDDATRYERVLSQADRVITLAEKYSKDVFFRRNDYLVKQADCIIAYFNGVPTGGTAYTVRHARRERVMVENIYPQQQLSLF